MCTGRSAVPADPTGYCSPSRTSPRQERPGLTGFCNAGRLGASGGTVSLPMGNEKQSKRAPAMVVGGTKRVWSKYKRIKENKI